MKIVDMFSCLFGHNIIFNGLYQAFRNNIVVKKTTELVHIFHKNIIKLIFLWHNMSQKSIKVLKEKNKSLFMLGLNYRGKNVLILLVSYNNGIIT